MHHDDRSEPTCMVCKLVDDVHDITSTGNLVPLRPRIVLNRGCWNPRFRNPAQQDASEAWNSLLATLVLVDIERLEASGLLVQPRSTSFWSYCGGSQTVTIHCRSCNSRSHLEEPLAELELLVQKQYELSSLDEAMLHHLGEGHVEGVHESCMAVDARWKETTLSTPPRLLSITLKRWERISELKVFSKVGRHISFPVVWPLTYQHTYYLRGVVEHTGEDNAGHYVSYVRCLSNDWYFCDDFVSPRRCSEEDVMRAQAYLLIDERA